MKKSAFLLLILPLFFACQTDEQDKEIIKVKKVAAVIPEEDLFDYDTLTGIYKGDFSGSEIRIILTYVSGSNAIGYNIHKGLQRNLNGKVSRSGDTIDMILEEPGDHEYDGIFNLRFIGIDDTPSGNWTPINDKIDSKEFMLSKVIISRDYENETAENFVTVNGTMYDTIGHYLFQDDGLVVFDYYPSDLKEGASIQKQEVTGNWIYTEDSLLRIDWQPNKLFNRTEYFKLTRHFYDDDDEYYDLFLEGEGRNIHAMFY